MTEQPTAPPGLHEAFRTDFGIKFPNAAPIWHAVKEDYQQSGQVLNTGLLAINSLILPYQFSGLAEASLVGSGLYAYDKTGNPWIAGAAQAGTSIVLETALGGALALAMRRFPKGIAAYAEAVYGNNEKAVKYRSPTMTLGRYAGIGWFLGTPGIMSDSLIREPRRGIPTHMRRGAIAVGLLAGGNYAIGAGLPSAVEGAVAGVTSEPVKNALQSTKEFLQSHGLNAINQGIHEGANLIYDGAVLVGDHVPAAVVAGIGLYGAIKLQKVAKSFHHTKVAIADLFKRGASGGKPSQENEN